MVTKSIFDLTNIISETLFSCINAMNTHLQLNQMIKDNDWQGVDDYLSHRPNYRLNARDSMGKTPFDYVKTVQMANVLHKYKIDINQLAPKLNYYIKTQNEPMINWMLSISNLNVNVEDKIGETPLFTAIKENDVKTVRALLKKGASCR